MSMLHKLTLQTGVLFQIINHKDGTRTPPVATTFQKLRDFIEERLQTGFDTTDEEDKSHDYFDDLVLIVSDDSEGSMLVSDFPLFRIENFVQATEFLVKNSNQEEVQS